MGFVALDCIQCVFGARSLVCLSFLDDVETSLLPLYSALRNVEKKVFILISQCSIVNIL